MYFAYKFVARDWQIVWYSRLVVFFGFAVIRVSVLGVFVPYGVFRLGGVCFGSRCGAVAPIKVTADLRAGLIHCAVTVPAPREGRSTTRVNWLVRQLKAAPGNLCIEASTAWQRGRGPARTLDQAREDPKSLVDDPDHELRSFTVSLSSNAGPARGQGHGSFVNSVLAAVEKFYTDVVQHIKPWAAAPPRVKDTEPSPPEELVPRDNQWPATAALAPAGELGHTNGLACAGEARRSAMPSPVASQA